MAHILELPKQHFKLVKTFVFVLCATPFLNLLWDFYFDILGINKLDHLTDSTGIWTLNFLLLSFSVTPMRRLFTHLAIKFRIRYGKRLSDWNWIIRLRRTLSLYAFFYSCIHLIIFVWLDQDFDWENIYLESAEKPYILLGIIAWCLLVPLAITSTDRIIRYLGKTWRILHRSIYIILVLSVMHYLLLSKVGVYTSWWYFALITILLSERFIFNFNLAKKILHDDGMEVPERPVRPS